MKVYRSEDDASLRSSVSQSIEPSATAMSFASASGTREEQPGYKAETGFEIFPQI
jgi:hypothetical protein